MSASHCLLPRVSPAYSSLSPCALRLMVLGVPDAIIPEHSQAEPGGGSHLLLWFLMVNLERASERKREEEVKVSLSPRFFSPLSAPVLDKELLKSAGCILGCFMRSETKKNRDKRPVSNTRDERERKKNHINMRIKKKKKHICWSFYFQAPHLDD